MGRGAAGEWWYSFSLLLLCLLVILIGMKQAVCVELDNEVIDALVRYKGDRGVTRCGWLMRL